MVATLSSKNTSAAQTRVKVPKYITKPETRINGHAMQAFVKSVLYDEIKSFQAPVMERYGYTETTIDVEHWYPLQMYLDFCKELHEKSSNSLVLVSIGIKVIDTALFPSEINSIASAARLLMDTHHLNLQNVAEYDRYHDLVIEDRRVTLVETTAFPHDIMYGYFYGVAHRFKPEDTHPIVERYYLDEADPDSDGAKYEIVW